MNPRLIFLCLLMILCVVGFAQAQTQSTNETQSQAQSAETVTPTPQDVEIMYTGKLLGYFRVPSLQPRGLIGCPSANATNDSSAANMFINFRKAKENAILVGTGDNFAPQLEARVFTPSVTDSQKETYQIENKELFLGRDRGWILYNEANEADKKRMKEGNGTIPSDNVACFLRAANFKAIVPGKHDFYFGAERVRQYARFLAKEVKGENAVQMLGANLVIETSPIESVSIPEYAKKTEKFDKWPPNILLTNLGEGTTVYPWLSNVGIKLAEPKADSDLASFLDNPENLNLQAIIARVKDSTDIEEKKLLANLTSLRLVNSSDSLKRTFRLCRGLANPNDYKPSGCEEFDTKYLTWKQNKLTFHLDLTKLKPQSNLQSTKGFFSTLQPGQNFLLCTSEEEIDKPSSTTYQLEPKVIPGCVRFSSYVPFFYFPNSAPQKKTTGPDYEFTDPDPYVIDNERNVAIFGVVDPATAEQVGVLNFGWVHDRNDLTAKLRVADPVDALTQQLEYFEKRHPTFSGVKVLLAQTTPQRAKALAARFPEFQVVVSGADQEQATSELKLSTVWKSKARSAGPFLAVPAPYYDSAVRFGTVYRSIVHATPQINDKKVITGWLLESKDQDLFKNNENKQEDKAIGFWDRLKRLKGCYDTDDSKHKPETDAATENKTYLKWLVLCAMQKHTGADVAMIQSRDLFDQIPLLLPNEKNYLDRKKPEPNAESSDSSKTSSSSNLENFQQMLDRLIWKGDLVTMLYLPGEQLKKVLDQSAIFEKAEKGNLTLSVERGRKLETLGIRKTNGEYFINELLVENKKYYAVATTDFIGAGDTGYPELISNAINPRKHPQAFSDNLVTISSLACRQLFDTKKEKDTYCLPEIVSEDYLDKTVAAQTPTYSRPSALRRWWDSAGLTFPRSDSRTKTISDAIERQVSRRSYWNYSLKSFAVTLSNLNKNLSDKEVKDKFGGVASSEVTAKEYFTVELALDNRVSRSAFGNEFFVGGGFNYKRVSTGDDTEADPLKQNFPDVTYPNNRIFAETGYIFWRRPGRDNLNLGLSLSLYTETQFIQPYKIFTLASKDEIKIEQDRSRSLFPRLGLRWQNRANYAEVGIQRGWQFRVLDGYQFDTAAGPIPCDVVSTKPVASCISEAAALTIKSPVTVKLRTSPQGGFYWKGHIAIPIIDQLKFELDEEGDFFLENSRSTSVDTRRREMTKIKFAFTAFPNLSIGPTLTLLRYRNQINKDFLFQHTFGVEMKWAFDIFNRQEKGVQVTNKLN